MQSFMMLVAITVLLCSLWIAYHGKQPVRPGSGANGRGTPRPRPVPVRKDGVIFVSDGAKGSARQASIELAKHGYHVLVGCKTDAEIRSFAFDSRKGLELIKFDLSEPATFVSLIYRLREIRRDLDRPIVGIIVNLVGYLEDYGGEVSTDYLNIISLDRHYKALFKGPVRLLQSIFELLRHYAVEEDKSNSLLLTESAQMPSSTAIHVDTGGLRVTTLYGEYALGEEVLFNTAEHFSLCGNKCDVQAGFLNYILGFHAATQEYSNFTLAQIREELTVSQTDKLRFAGLHGSGLHGVTKSSGSSNTGDVSSGVGMVDLVSPRGERAYDDQVKAWRLKKVEAHVHNHVKWSVKEPKDGDKVENGDDDAETIKMDRTTRAIMHSFLSKFPEQFYF